MDNKPTVIFPIIVEGKYDKIKLHSLFNADVFTTDGFGVFRREDKTAFFRLLAKKSPIIILTDSDGAGLVIRNYFRSILPSDRLIHIYTPEVKGKERRKVAPSKAGCLGVEGIDADVLRGLIMPYTVEGAEERGKGNELLSIEGRGEPLTKADLFALGLSGGVGSAEKRKRVASVLGLPSDISSNAFIEAVELLFGRDEFIRILGENGLC